MNDQDGYRLEAAECFGFSQAEDDGPYTCTEAQLIAFAKAAERKGLAMAHGLANRDAVYRHILDLDAELAPIQAAEEERSMLAAGYVRGTDEPGKRWVKPCPYETAVRKQGWVLKPDGIFERSASDEPERVHLLGDWKELCEFAAITVSEEPVQISDRAEPALCDGCDQNPSDPPSKLCPGCQAYREHTS